MAITSYFTINLVYWYTSYLTWWIFTIFVIDRQTYFSKLFISTGFIGGIYITYIHPRYLCVKYLNIYVSGFQLKVCDFIFHTIPFLYTMRYNISKFNLNQYLLYLIVCSIYLLFNDPVVLYNVRKKDTINGFLLCHLLFFLIENKLIE